MALSEGQELTVAIATWVASLLSIYGSCTLIGIVLKHKKYQLDGYHRLLLGLSIFDLFITTAWALGPLVPPAATSERYLAIGTVETCTMAGFFFQLGLGSVLYNAMLSIYFVLVIRYGITQQQLARREWFLHGFGITFSVVTSIAGLPMELFNESSVGLICWIQRSPIDCGEEGQEACRRAESANAYGYLFGVVPIFAVPVVLVCNVLIYVRVQTNEQASRRHIFNGETDELRLQRAKKVLTQATLYVLAFLNSTLWNIAIRNLDGTEAVERHNEQDYFFLILASQFFSPIQGFLNLVVYVRPRYVRMRERNRLLTRYEALQMALDQDPSSRRGGTPTSSQRRRSKEYEESCFVASPDENRRKQPIRSSKRTQRRTTRSSIAEILLMDETDLEEALEDGELSGPQGSQSGDPEHAEERESDPNLPLELSDSQVVELSGHRSLEPSSVKDALDAETKRQENSSPVGTVEPSV